MYHAGLNLALPLTREYSLRAWWVSFFPTNGSQPISVDIYQIRFRSCLDQKSWSFHVRREWIFAILWNPIVRTGNVGNGGCMVWAHSMNKCRPSPLGTWIAQQGSRHSLKGTHNGTRGKQDGQVGHEIEFLVSNKNILTLPLIGSWTIVILCSNQTVPPI